MRISLTRTATALAIVATMSLAACGGDKSEPAPAASAEAAALAPPASPAIEKLYNQTCHNCHTVPASGAPQAGDKVAWAPRVAQGREVLIDHSINGFRSMPPMGTCTQCSEDDFVALIEYMSGAKLK
jgi:cytochrome c5